MKPPATRPPSGVGHTLGHCLALLCLVTIQLTSGQEPIQPTRTCARVTTFNTGLTPSVAGAVNKRQDLITKAIKASRTDVMCLQEAWYESSVQAITSATKNQFPYHYSQLHSKVNVLDRRPVNSWLSFMSPDAPCNAAELSYIVTDIGTCALQNGCVSSTPDESGACMAKYCRSQLKSSRVSQSCLSCATFSLTSLKETVTKCGNVPGFKKSRFNGPGLVLLSKRPIKSARYVDFFRGRKMFVQRGYIDAEIEGLGRVVCTHLSANFENYLEFDMSYKSYEEQQRAEIRALSRLTSRDHIVMGDLNTGPSLTFMYDRARNIASSFPRNYQQLLSLGYSSPFASQVKLCTYCATNRYTEGDKSYILDHILLHGSKYENAVARRTLMSQDRQPMSDHYGVEVQFCARNDPPRTRNVDQRRFFQRMSRRRSRG